MELRRYDFEAMGGPAAIHLFANGATEAEQAAAAAMQEVARLERRYSRYRTDSLLSALNAQAAVGGEARLDDETAGLIDFAFACHQSSGGRFDVTSGLLRKVWNFEDGRRPEPAAIEALLPRIGMDKLVWKAPVLGFAIPGMELDLGGLVKEYAADRAAAACAAAGVAHALVELAGDIAAAGPQADGAPWTIGIRHPQAPERAVAVVELAGGGLASSGDYARGFDLDGVRYGHILDARTGWPAQGLAAASVVAESCLVAGAAATTAMLKGPDAGAWLAASGLRNLWIDTQGRHGGDLPLSGPLVWRD